MKIGWMLLDLILSIVGLVAIWSISRNFWCVLIAVGLMAWNYIDGRVRSGW